MKVNKFLTMMVAMAVGSAGAITAANSTISNTATATYTDPTNPTGPQLTSTSNTVTTTVLPKPSFDIIYASGKTDGSGTPTDPANSVSANTPDQGGTVAPGATVTDTYKLVNNGNTPLVVTIKPTATAGVARVDYSFANLPTGATVTGDATTGYKVTIPADTTIAFTQTTVVATTATKDTYVGATPVGTALTTDNTANGVTTNLSENQTIAPDGTVTGPATGTDLQYQAIYIANPVIDNTPDTTPPTPPAPGTPGGDLPGGGTPSYDGGTPPTSGTGTPPNGGGTPGATPIAIKGNEQIAYPPADNNDKPDVVVFTNTVTTKTADTLTLTPGSLTLNSDGTIPALVPGTTKVTDANGVTWTYTGPGTWTDGKNTVQFLDPATKTPIDTVTTTDTKPTADYLTQVTYPDSNSVPSPAPIKVEITATSLANPTVTAVTKDTIYPPAATFGDTAAVAQDDGAIEDPSKPYYPNNSLAPVNTQPGSTASYPMSISNNGEYEDNYNLSGAVPIKLQDGRTVVMPIVYTGATIDPAYTGDVTKPLGTTQIPGTAPVVINGTTYYAPVYTTAPVAANTTTGTTITATVAVPADALTTSAANPAPTLTQTASSVYSAKNDGELVMTDTNDLLAIGVAGNIVVGKFTQTGVSTPDAGTQYAVGNPATVSTTAPAAGITNVTNPGGYDGIKATSYQPGVNYSYQIIAKNGYNTDIANFALSDTLDTNLNYVSGTCTINGKSIGAATLANGTVTCPVETLPVGGTANLTITVSIK